MIRLLGGLVISPVYLDTDVGIGVKDERYVDDYWYCRGDSVIFYDVY